MLSPPHHPPLTPNKTVALRKTSYFNRPGVLRADMFSLKTAFWWRLSLLSAFFFLYSFVIFAPSWACPPCSLTVPSFPFPPQVLPRVTIFSSLLCCSHFEFFVAMTLFFPARRCFYRLPFILFTPLFFFFLRELPLAFFFSVRLLARDFLRIHLRSCAPRFSFNKTPDRTPLLPKKPLYIRPSVCEVSLLF